MKKRVAPEPASSDEANPPAEVPADNHQALDSLDAAADALGIGEPAGEEEEARPRPRKRGRPVGAGGAGPTKDEWRSRARAAEAKLRATTAVSAAVQVEQGANVLRGPLDLTVRYWFGRQAAAHGPHWLLSEPEVDALAGAWATALAPWAATLAKVAPAGVALTVTVQLIRDRQKIDHAGGAAPAAGPQLVQDPPAPAATPVATSPITTGAE